MKSSFLFTVLLSLWCICDVNVRRQGRYIHIHVLVCTTTTTWESKDKSEYGFSPSSQGSFVNCSCTPFVPSCHNSTGIPNTSYYTQHCVAAGIQMHAPHAQVLYLLSYLPALFFHSLQQCRLELINKLFQNYFIICVCRYSQKLKEGNGAPRAGVIGSYKSEC